MARRNDHTREQLIQLTLNTVTDFLEQHSYHELSLRKIANMIGYVPSTLVNVFGNYNLLLLHVVAKTLDELAAESAAAVEALKYYYGQDVINNILKEMYLGVDFQQAFESSSDETLLDFQINFERYLENNFNWVFLLRASKFVFVILPIILIIGFIYHRYRTQKIVKQWEIEEHLQNSEWIDKFPN